MQQLYESLVSVELPFFRKDSLPLKLSQAAAAVRCVLRDLKRDHSRGRRAAAAAASKKGMCVSESSMLTYSLLV